MSYIALYRKMRPKNFDQMVGQEHIVKTLRNQIKSDRISHAYLFCGTRGTGKTSAAKIFAKAINCIDSIDGQPCGKCESCLRIDSGADMNVIEIDAASNNSVDNIRELRDEVKYPPVDAKFKVYIIDEVHMLSAGAFNALLKTLEEPPAHVIFILATTDPQKIPITILSRCQRFDFKRISVSQISQTLKKYMDNENVLVSDDALNYIAMASDGAMRDALSIIDQCIAFYYGEEITLEKVLVVCGATDSGVFFEMTEALFEQDSKKCMEIIDKVNSDGRDIVRFINDIILHFRNVIVSATVLESSATMGFSKENAQKYKEQGEHINKEFLMEIINRFSELLNKIKYSSNPKVIFEVECLKICNPVGEENIEQIKMEMKNLKKIIGNTTNENESFKQLKMEMESIKEFIKGENTDFLNGLSANKATKSNDFKIAKVKAKPAAASEDLQEVAKQWRKFADNFKAVGKTFLLQAEPKILDNKFYVVCKTLGHFEMLNKIKDEVLQKLEEVYGKKFDLFIIKKEDFDAKCNEFDLEGVQIEFDMEEEINSKLDGVIWD